MPTGTVALEYYLDIVKTDISHVVWTTNYDPPTSADTLTTDNLEIGRVAVSSKTRTNLLLVVTSVLNNATALCLSTTVATDAGNSQTQMKLASVTNLSVNDRIEIQANTGTVDRKVLTIVGNIITIDAALTSTPATGIIVRQKISRMALIALGDNSRLSGMVIEWASFIKFHDDSMSPINGTWNIPFKGD